MRARIAIAAGAIAALGGAPSLAPAQDGEPSQGPAPFDGSNPFDCVLQQAGTGATFPDPGADPFCVEYDKRHQNVTQLGVVEFLSLEPARVAAASPKCFYFQRDHWVGSVVQDDGRTRTYSWDGSYYFDKARGAGGAYVENFGVNNQSGDPTGLPGFPDEWRPFFGYGRGGFHNLGGVEADPSCAAKARERSPYRVEAEEKPAAPRCPEPGGTVGRSIGGLRLGATRKATLAANGEPRYRRRGFLRYCVRGGGKLMAGFPADRDGARAAFLLTGNPGFSVSDVRRLTPERQMRARLRGERLLFRIGRTDVWALRKSDHVLLVVVQERRVRLLASALRSLSRDELISYYRRSK